MTETESSTQGKGRWRAKAGRRWKARCPRAVDELTTDALHHRRTMGCWRPDREAALDLVMTVASTLQVSMMLNSFGVPAGRGPLNWTRTLKR